MNKRHRVHTNRVKGTIIRRANNQLSFFSLIYNANVFKKHALKTTRAWSAYWFIPLASITQKPQILSADFLLQSSAANYRIQTELQSSNTRPAHWKCALEIHPQPSFPGCYLNMAVLIPASLCLFVCFLRAHFLS